MSRSISNSPSRRQVVSAISLGAPLLGVTVAWPMPVRAQAPKAKSAYRKIELAAADGHKFVAYRADPAAPAKGGIVVLHAVYGLATAMGDTCAMWADAGYTAIAPALFDRHTRDLVHPYTREGVGLGSKSYAQLTEAQILADVGACAVAAGPAGRVAMSGFCTGGTWAWVAASKLAFAAHVSFYPSHVHQPAYFDLEPRCPTIVHFGDKDPVVPLADVERIRTRHPKAEMHLYPGAVHAFLNPDQASYHAPSAGPAWQRSIAFMDTHIGAKAK